MRAAPSFSGTCVLVPVPFGEGVRPQEIYKTIYVCLAAIHLFSFANFIVLQIDKKAIAFLLLYP